MKNKTLIIFIILILTSCTATSHKINKNESQTSISTKILAGTTTPYIEFNNKDYQKALADNKTVLLYFYANWCPLCKLEQAQTFSAFNELNKTNFIGKINEICQKTYLKYLIIRFRKYLFFLFQIFLIIKYLSAIATLQ